MGFRALLRRPGEIVFQFVVSSPSEVLKLQHPAAKLTANPTGSKKVATMGIETLPQRNHLDVMAELVPLAGAVALEIGCGEGRFTRLMAGGGARVTGIDSGPHQIKRALAQPRVAGETYCIGTAEALEATDGWHFPQPLRVNLFRKI